VHKARIVTILLLCVGIRSYSSDVVFKRGESVSFSIEGDSSQVVRTALNLFSGDLKAVLGSSLEVSRKADIVIKTRSPREALSIAAGESFSFLLPESSDSVSVTLAFVPNHPVGGDSLEALVSIDMEEEQRLRYDTRGRSEEWKQNVERNQALRTLTLPPSKKSRKINITALTEGVILDEVVVERR